MTLTYIFHSGNKRIFHAGDLNNWYAKFLPEAMPGETIYSEEPNEQREQSRTCSSSAESRERKSKAQFDEDIDPIAHEKQYLGELKDIRKITDSFDVVMFPIDGRIGRSSSARLLPTGRKNGYTLGEPSSSLEWPSRDGTRRSQSAWRMKEFTDEKGIPFWEITREGETIEI